MVSILIQFIKFEIDYFKEKVNSKFCILINIIKTFFFPISKSYIL